MLAAIGATLNLTAPGVQLQLPAPQVGFPWMVLALQKTEELLAHCGPSQGQLHCDLHVICIWKSQSI